MSALKMVGMMVAMAGAVPVLGMVEQFWLEHPVVVMLGLGAIMVSAILSVGCYFASRVTAQW